MRVRWALSFGMSKVPPDIEKSERLRAREADDWRQGRNGGWLRPLKRGEGQKTGYRKPNNLIETLRLARQASPDAVRTLIKRLDEPDGRVAVVAASHLLERAWGRPREQQAEQSEEHSIDLRGLSAEELAVMTKLVLSGRLRATAGDPAPPGPDEIEGELRSP
jgi:hypothetical protein